jgi:FlaA1/EpsC-like NDP-sugar epimerase
VIFGAGASGRTTKQIIDGDPTAQMWVVGFLEDDRSKVGKTYNGVRIYNAAKDLARLVSEYNVHELIIAVTKISIDRKNEIVDEALKLNLKIREVPPVEQWVQGGFSVKQIKNIKIEDLLGRETIRLDNPILHRELNNKVIMITGAAGSIGRHLSIGT